MEKTTVKTNGELSVWLRATLANQISPLPLSHFVVIVRLPVRAKGEATCLSGVKHLMWPSPIKFFDITDHIEASQVQG